MLENQIPSEQARDDVTYAGPIPKRGAYIPTVVFEKIQAPNDAESLYTHKPTKVQALGHNEAWKQKHK